MNKLRNIALLFLTATVVLSCAAFKRKGGSQLQIVEREVSFQENGVSYKGSLFVPEYRKEANKKTTSNKKENSKKSDAMKKKKEISKQEKNKKLPVVIVVHEWWGKNEYAIKRAEMLAKELGVIALAVDLYGNGKTVETPKEAEALAMPFYKDTNKGVRLLERYIKEVKKDSRVDKEKVFAIGYCFGGSQVLNLVRLSSQNIAAVASFHGGLKGASVKKGKKINAKIFVYHGDADPMVPAKEVADFKAEMSKADLAFNHYPGATHAFSNPKSTEIGKKYNIPIGYNKKADMGSWNDLKKNFKSLF
jgi:dienelactone hydrolase